MENRTQTITVTLPSGTAAGTYERKDVLDSTYDRATGFVAYVNSDGGQPIFQLGMRNDSQVFASPTNINYFLASDACPKPARLTPVVIACDNTNLTMQLVVPAQLTSALVVDIVFQLERADRAR